MSAIRELTKAIVPLRLRPRGLVDRLVAETLGGMVVRGGPFEGMRYTNEGYGVLLAKLCGTYECELWPVLRELLNAKFDRFIDVGAGDGYYVTGFALRSRSREIVGRSFRPFLEQYLERLRLLDLENVLIRLIWFKSDLLRNIYKTGIIEIKG